VYFATPSREAAFPEVPGKVIGYRYRMLLFTDKKSLRKPNTQDAMITSEKNFYRVLLLGLLLCVALYAEETVHFIHYGLNSPYDELWMTDISKCQQVRGSSTELECPIKGYGLVRCRYKNHRDPGHNTPKDLEIVY
jgi:hypothetical protein